MLGCAVLSPPVTRRLLITEQASLAQLHAALQVALGVAPLVKTDFSSG
jgi:hypothetical protein